MTPFELVISASLLVASGFLGCAAISLSRISRALEKIALNNREDFLNGVNTLRKGG